MDGRRIRNNKVPFSNLSGIVWTGPKAIIIKAKAKAIIIKAKAKAKAIIITMS